VSLLTEVLAHPQRLDQLGDAGWDELLRFARFTALSSRLHALIVERDLLEQIPAAARDVIQGANTYTSYMQLLARRELRTLNRVFEGVNFPVVLLKGAAYIQSGLPVAVGRRLSDIDILVPHGKLVETEGLLSRAGWQFEDTLTTYDERYYREWSHELPPMRHPHSPIELDVHHNLIQPTSRIKLDSAQFFVDLVPFEGTVFSMLSPPDMVLHSATHLFMSDELRGGLRDLVDMHMLCNHFSEQDSDYWVKLAARAEVLGLQRPLYYAAAAMRRLLDTAIPDSAWQAIAANRPNWFTECMMNRIIDSHLAPDNMARMHSWYAEQLLFIRSHWIRMPPLMLVRHLASKWLAGRRSPAE
jgi:hypothetical protein